MSLNRVLARAYSQLVLVASGVPIVAPIAGSQLLRVVDWRGVFGVLAVIGGLLAVASATLPETLPLERRRGGGLRVLAAGLHAVLSERLFVTSTLVASCAGAATFTYISLSSIVLQNGFEMSAQTFSVVFAVNALGFILASFVNSRLVTRYSPRALLVLGATLQAGGAVACLSAGLLDLGLPFILPALFAVLFGNGFSSTNAFALALARHGEHAGTASAVAGTGPFLLGAIVAPLAGLAGVRIVPMAVVLTVSFTLGLLVVLIGVYPAAVALGVDDGYVSMRPSP